MVSVTVQPLLLERCISFEQWIYITLTLSPPPGVVAVNYLFIYAPKRLLLAGSFLAPTTDQRPSQRNKKKEQKPYALCEHQSGSTMMEGSSSSATAIEHGSEDSAPLIRPGGGGGGVTSALPVEIERLGKMYVVCICCWLRGLVLMGSSIRWLVRAVGSAY